MYKKEIIFFEDSAKIAIYVGLVETLTLLSLWAQLWKKIITT